MRDYVRMYQSLDSFVGQGQAIKLHTFAVETEQLVLWCRRPRWFDCTADRTRFLAINDQLTSLDQATLEERMRHYISTHSFIHPSVYPYVFTAKSSVVASHASAMNHTSVDGQAGQQCKHECLQLAT